MKSTVDMSQTTSPKTLLSHPNSPQPKSSLSSLSKTMALPSIATSWLLRLQPNSLTSCPLLCDIIFTTETSKPYIFIFKGRDASEEGHDGSKGEHETGVAIEQPPVATDQQPGVSSSSSTIQAFSLTIQEEMQGNGLSSKVFI